ncbi:MAG: M4 family metallopeptidase [Phycisphaerae bacterium]
MSAVGYVYRRLRTDPPAVAPRLRRVARVFAVPAVVLVVAFGGQALAAGGTNKSDALHLRVSRATGVASFVTAGGGEPITADAQPWQRQADPLDFIREYGQLFGVADPERELVVTGTRRDGIGHTRVTYRQVHQGVEVFAGMLHVHFNADGRPIAANGTFVPGISVDTTPRVNTDAATDIALAAVRRRIEPDAAVRVLQSKLYVFRANLARGRPGRNHLVYEVEVGNGRDVREFLYVDAHKGYVVDRISGMRDAIDRRVYNGGYGSGFLVWSEGDHFPIGDVDIDNLIEYSADTYNLVASATQGAFLSWDGSDGIMHSVNDDPTINCPNANWNGVSTNYCIGITADDTVAHEWGHAYTDSTHNLIYQYQPGALNESYSDIFGEVVDYLNGSGTDTPDAPRGDDQCSTLGGSPPPLCDVHSPSNIAGVYAAAGAAFNPPAPLTVTADVQLAYDGDDEEATASMTDACQPLIGFSPGRIALADRGTCAFTTKVNNAAAAGAVGVIVVNTRGNRVFRMSGWDPAITIPSVLIGRDDGNSIRGELPNVVVTIALEEAMDASVRWLAGEDDVAFGGAIRDMWNPNCFSHPGKVSDVGYYACGVSDNGGVHVNSGVPNHAFALLVDGGVYNGIAVRGIGLTKAFHIYWRAETTYQVPATHFPEHADALEQSCMDLLGVDLPTLDTEVPARASSGEIISAADCAQLAGAIDAVELRAEPVQCEFAPMLKPGAPPLCGTPGTLRRFYVEDWESGLGEWAAGTRDLADAATFDTPDWAVVDPLPDGHPGRAAFVADLTIGDCGADTEAGVLWLESPPITIPPAGDVTRIAFDHRVATEALWDGGNLKVSVNGGPWTVIGSAQFDFNAYPGRLNGPSNNDNPLAGEEAFTGTDGGDVDGSWGQSQLNLSGIAAAGNDVRLRFEMGLDGCNGIHGWYVDTVQVYYCCDAYGDVDCDGSLDLYDYVAFADCLSGPERSAFQQTYPAWPTCYDYFDSDADLDIDLADFALLQRTAGTR